MIRIQAQISDDLEFTYLVESLVNRLVDTVSPGELYLVKIDHWFDFKWRGFQGKLHGALGLRAFERLRVPPFIPDRVIEQRHFEKDGGGYNEQEAGLHFYQSSSKNLTSKCLVAVSSPRLFIWYSGGTKDFHRGSLMVYVIEPEGPKSFYISLSKGTEWGSLKTDGISKNEALSLIAPVLVNQ
ncbi:MAG TPA: hypothetical protein PKE66_17970 [Pyrinomonadaceae bacterium]|nr:hypothetical protein [Pyrinomonadaceae bacterium]